jgi:hypothetical protein
MEAAYHYLMQVPEFFAIMTLPKYVTFDSLSRVRLPSLPVFCSWALWCVENPKHTVPFLCLNSPWTGITLNLPAFKKYGGPSDIRKEEEERYIETELNSSVQFSSVQTISVFSATHWSISVSFPCYRNEHLHASEILRFSRRWRFKSWSSGLWRHVMLRQDTNFWEDFAYCITARCVSLQDHDTNLHSSLLIIPFVFTGPPPRLL